mmetsp:Transcript_2111/g.6344  ORF Transcript_2111/g.6344 Transcript_2111/m.6344 type:complete len:212 (+) Transcript_2111:210-845(+)
MRATSKRRSSTVSLSGGLSRPPDRCIASSHVATISARERNIGMHSSVESSSHRKSGNTSPVGKPCCWSCRTSIGRSSARTFEWACSLNREAPAAWAQPSHKAKALPSGSVPMAASGLCARACASAACASWGSVQMTATSWAVTTPAASCTWSGKKDLSAPTMAKAGSSFSFSTISSLLSATPCWSRRAAATSLAICALRAALVTASIRHAE